MRRVIGIATTGDRPEQLDNTLESLKGQADTIYVWDNSKDGWYNFTDNGKFKFLEYYNEPIYYLSCDDDIIYPKDYVKRTVEEIDYNQCIISWHGRVLNPEVEGYYAHGHREMRFFQANEEYYYLDVCGTGVTGFSTANFNPTTIYRSEYKRMSDLVFSLEAAKNNKIIMTAPKKHNWIRGQEVKSSIFKSENRGKQTQQIKLMEEIKLCKGL
jgi:hypothetical protein